MKSMESTVTPRSPMGSLGLERKKSVTFGAREVLLLDKDSGRREVQSYQIDGMDWKESSDLGDCDVPPPPHPFAPDCGLEEHSVEANEWLIDLTTISWWRLKCRIPI